MKKIILISILVLSVLIIGCEKHVQELEISEADNSSTAQKTDPTCSINLIAGQFYVVGTVEVTFNYQSEIALNYLMSNQDWCLEETHFDVQVNPDGFPQTRSGNPKVGHFAYGTTLYCAASWSQTLDLNNIPDWEEGDIIYIAAHAEVVNITGQKESAWGEGTSFPGNSWAMYFSCEPPPDWTCGYPFVDARDGQEYNTVQIGDQCWMAENLNVGTMINGSDDQTDNGTIEKYCYGNNPANCNAYGGLYQWNEMMQYTTQPGTQGICPPGLHLPTDEEWKILEGTVDSQYGIGDPEWDNIAYRGYDAGTNLKTTSGWYFSGNGTDLNRFSGLPGGFRNDYGHFFAIGYYGYWWSSTEGNLYHAWYRILYGDKPEVYRDDYIKVWGNSVRCIKD